MGSEREPTDLGDLIYQMTDHGLDPQRPFTGQPHTDQGERGKTMVTGLTFRDVCDCFVVGWLMASGRSSLAESGTASYNDVYEPGINTNTGEPDHDIDPLAVMQNMSCEMERRMGIFPNVPPLSPRSAPGERPE